MKPKPKFSEKTVLETSEVSSAVQEIANSIESEHAELQHFGVSLSGTPERIRTPEDTENAKFLSYITNENFGNLDSHIFSLSEIQNLMSSSDSRQRIFALDLVSKLVQRSPQVALQNIFRSEFSGGIVLRMKNLVASGKWDVFTIFLEIFNCILKHVLNKAQTLRDQSLCNFTSINTGVSLFQVYLEDMIG